MIYIILSEQGLYDNINKYRNANSINYGYQAVARFSRELSDCIDLLCYYDRWENGCYYNCDFKNLALDDYAYASWSSTLRAKDGLLNCCVSTEFKDQLKALSAYHKQLHFNLGALSHYAFLQDVVSLHVGENAIDVLGVCDFMEEVNSTFPYSVSFALDKNLPYSSVVNALGGCLGYFTNAQTQGLPWLKNEMKNFAPEVESIIKFIKSSDEYRQERLAVVQSGKVWVN